MGEADTHRASPVMAMGGFLSLADDWQAFDERWVNTLLYAHNLTYSHAVDLVHRDGEFRGWGNNQHYEFVLGARELTSGHLKVGFVVFLRRDDYQRCYRVLPKPKKPPEDSMYGMLFRTCVSFALTAVSAQLNEDVQGEVVDFVVESRGNKRNYASQLLQRFRSDPQADPMFRAMLGDLDFADKKVPMFRDRVMKDPS